MKLAHFILLGIVVAALTSCGSPWNNPYPADQRGKSVLYSSFSERPKHLDPVQSYSENEYLFIGQIYTPPLQYHYLKRPYELIPLAAETLPQPRYFDHAGAPLPDNASAAQIAYSVYEIKLRKGMRYQPHPAFAKGADGKPRYLGMSESLMRDIHELRDFPEVGSREVLASDFVYQIKRLAHPHLHSPILGLMGEYIVGLNEYAERLKQTSKNMASGQYIDLDQFPIDGVRVVDEQTYTIRIKGKYPQFMYWLAMPFFVPIPPEADRFYSQPGMAKRNLNFDWYPVGSGPYMLTVNNPNRQMVLERNPNYFSDTYPTEGDAGDQALGLLASGGRALPIVDKVVYSLEKEAIPTWNKFLQGYYDTSGISSDDFDRVIELAGTGEPQLTDEMRAQGVTLQTSVAPSTSYFGFNMLDPVVGGDSERARKLRQAIAIAFDVEEMIAIFMNGRGVPAQGPIAPGIFGYLDGQRGINPLVYEWRENEAQRRPIQDARRLLSEAGYAGGVDSQSGKPLVLNFDTAQVGAQSKPMLDWLVKQFKKIDIDLVIRNTDYNRFQEKMRKGTAQIYRWGWNADYPDPENFMFLLYGPQGKVKSGGQNASNYLNPEYDKLFEQMRDMENGPQRQAIIDRMNAILREDAPWIWGVHPKEFALSHQWVSNRKSNKMAHNSLKYQAVDPLLRDALRSKWNRPVLWPVVIVLAVVLLVAWPSWVMYRRRERSPAVLTP